MTEKPRYLGHMFVARGLGFWMAEAPPFDLLAPRVLQDKNPWVVLAALVERAKRGDFVHLSRIVALLHECGDGAFWYACLETLSRAAPSSVLKQLVREFPFDAADATMLWRIEYILDTLRQSLLLWTVPIMLNVYVGVENRSKINERAADRDEPSLILVPPYLSQLLEKEPGPIAEADLPDADYSKVVKEMYEQRCQELGSSEAAVLNGELFSVRSTAERLLGKLSAKQINELEVAEERMLFEASTGVDCRAFFKDFKLQRLTAAAIVEGFLEGPDAAKYQDGVRYFFGHRIPD